ncbi:variable large family protein, partial [Borreliella garinii]|uniref:variable large family protein n=2 Tax=Borreliella garinii TaxID=29519 RepID=UPI001AEFBCF2
MKKITSAVLLIAFFVFTNCKNSAGDISNKSDENDPTTLFYQSIIKLGNGFLEVFTSFGGMVADAFGAKWEAKKSTIKTYFDTMSQKLEETKKGLEKLANNGEESESENKIGDAVASTIKEVGEWLTEMATAAGGAAKVADGDGEIGKVENAGNNDNKGDKTSVNGIANGIKAIVGVAK